VKVGIVGVGHVGLPTAATLAHIGHRVAAMDSDREKLILLGSGSMPFFEPGLEELVRTEADAGRLAFTSDPAEVADGADVVFICVGTPPKASGEANLLAVERAAETIATHATGDIVIVEKSTVPAGTAERLSLVLRRHRQEHRFLVASNPEFLQEGRAIEDSLHPARVLVGSNSPEALRVMRELYAPLIEDGALWIETDVATAELAKHASNAFLAMKISFANALARLCELSGADVVKVADAMGADPRIGRSFLDAGLGYGGYCFPKDLAAFEQLAAKLGYDFGLLREIRSINDDAVEAVFKKIEESLWNLQDKRIALLGLAFKAGTDDIRLSPSLKLGRMLLDHGARVVGYDPQAAGNAKGELDALEVASGVYEAIEGAHCAVIGTEWPEFSSLDLERAREVMKFPIIVDGRNMLDPRTAAAAGFTYLPTGRPAVGTDQEKP
jgi:UDPglucose 6-dehydrogenase